MFKAVARCALAQLRSQLDGGRAGQAQQGGVGDLLELIPNGLVDGGHLMAMHIAPQAADAIDVVLAFGVDQIKTFAAFNDQRRAFAPLAHGA